MSVEYSAQVVCGFKIEEKEITALETRYNHLTGEPYKIEIKNTKYFIGDIELENFRDIYVEEEFQGLDVIEAGDDYKNGFFLGEMVAATGEHYPFYDEFLINVPVKIRKFGEEVGIAPSFFLTFGSS